MSSTRQVKSTKNNDEELVRYRLKVLQFAEDIGNVQEACRRMNMNRTSFYKWRRRFKEHGIEGLRTLPPVHNTHPETTTEDVARQIIEISLRNPQWGCVKIADWLKRKGVSSSSPTVQKILIKHSMGNKNERLLKLEEKHLKEAVELTTEQFAMIEKVNPCFKERHAESKRPGELLCQDSFYLGAVKSLGRVYLLVVLDTFNSYAFCLLYRKKLPLPNQALTLLHNDILPFYKTHNIKIDSILTVNDHEYHDTESQVYEGYLKNYDIEHRRNEHKSSQTNGFIERFRKTLRDEFVREALRERSFESFEVLSEALKEWLVYYNTERPHMGYRNMGKTPIEAFSCSC